MDLVALAMDHPTLAWLTLGAVLLAAEVATGTGWLLWAVGSAWAVCLLTLAVPLGLPWQVVLFAVLTIATSLLGRRFFPPGHKGDGEDINDNVGRLIGRHARVVTPFEQGRGRVAIDGKEWAAVLEGGAPTANGFVEVVSASGGELNVRGA